jgi:heat shock protein HslJ
MSATSRVRVVLCVAIAAAACSRQPGTEASTARVDSTASLKPAVDSPAASPALRGTDWKLVALGDKPVTPTDTQRVAHFLLQPDSKQVAGSGGCNRMFGIYELNGGALRFSGVGSTKMACRDGMDTESAFLAALLRVARWRMNGQQLELSDAAGAVLAKFEARGK